MPWGISLLAQGVADVGWNVGSGPPALQRRRAAQEERLSGALFRLDWHRRRHEPAPRRSLVDATRGLQLGGQPLSNPFLPLLLIGLILPIVAAFVIRRLNDDSTVRFSQFPGLFLRGNPFLAIEAVIRYSRAGDEEAVVRNTERLGSAQPMTTEELLEALEDPLQRALRGDVAMARVGFEPRWWKRWQR